MIIFIILSIICVVLAVTVVWINDMRRYYKKDQEADREKEEYFRKNAARQEGDYD